MFLCSTLNLGQPYLSPVFSITNNCSAKMTVMESFICLKSRFEAKASTKLKLWFYLGLERVLCNMVGCPVWLQRQFRPTMYRCIVVIFRETVSNTSALAPCFWEFVVVCRFRSECQITSRVFALFSQIHFHSSATFSLLYSAPGCTDRRVKGHRSLVRRLNEIQSARWARDANHVYKVFPFSVSLPPKIIFNNNETS